MGNSKRKLFKKKLNSTFALDKEKRQRILSALKSYTKTNDPKQLAIDLKSILKSDQDRSFIKEIFHCVPEKHHDAIFKLVYDINESNTTETIKRNKAIQVKDVANQDTAPIVYQNVSQRTKEETVYVSTATQTPIKQDDVQGKR